MVWQPEDTKGHHYGQDELLTVDLSLELGIPQASQDQYITHYNDGIGHNESQHCLKGVLEPHLYKDTNQVLYTECHKRMLNFNVVCFCCLFFHKMAFNPQIVHLSYKAGKKICVFCKKLSKSLLLFYLTNELYTNIMHEPLKSL